ncbi:MAG: LysE/ArgO family amino acid transporter [Beijerinckiaceae bacterium]|jgi:L-lysine exporter family protein LysE/ArgO|nr:LysE/ArgO family amino acid transporter [Beijerinckiaceae bacterium]
MLSPFVSGFLIGGGLIIAIGAQNAFILRQGIRREHVFPLALICSLSDALLIALGVAGLGALIQLVPALLTGVTLFGIAFLLWYGWKAARRALAPQAMEVGESGPVPLGAAIRTCLALTFLNPHVYLDTVVLVGALAAPYAGLPRLAYATGAMTASFAWFFSLAYGARVLTPVFRNPLAWRILDALIALVMVSIAGKLALWLFSR